ncbi:S8 family serine peptidase [Pontibacter lucknowensis]|uniref:Por secretion system C-terminal sorting domain-containing protein n=1 Tax=Pontibacter lucknowensis TaxID=1077936 RepID=A0A1N6WP38_9BACT|nr:S8 family serine peptidase [Pontibacter lucknowensis]SIQ91791.1 Por secretion system C-terminal sorting domain-containing protein [Pontibacter lucknowensis]
MRHLFLLVLLLTMALYTRAQGGDGAQQKHLIFFTDKDNSPYSIAEPALYLSAKAIERRSKQGIALSFRDLPVNPAYVSDIKAAGAIVLYTSRWFNAAVVQCSPQKLAELQTLAFVKGTQQLNRLPASNKKATQSNDSLALAKVSFDPSYFGPSFHQSNMLGIPELHAAGYQGEGMTIAVFDAGFPGVNSIGAFSHLFQNGQLKGTYDFVGNKTNVYGHSQHGTSVLSTMAAYDPGRIVGTAPKADYYLFRTEDAATEHNIEEVNWLLAAEFADSAGVDVINSSLGYTLFDAPSYSYTYGELNGNTTIVTRAADLAAATGMLVVTSAGNEGNKTWRYISAPADADSVLTVGAVDSLAVHALFSSVGPTADQRTKPDVVAMGQQVYVLSSSGALGRSSGTSFSGPIMAGMVACIWQARPKLTNMQLLELMRQLGSNYNNPNNSIGYGIPTYSRLVTGLADELAAGINITNPVAEDPIVLRMDENWQKELALAQLYDATGKLVYTQLLPAQQATHTLSIRPSRLKKGIYLCQISSNSKNVTLRFVKL